MNIIVRACGERTESKCIELSEKQGIVHVIRAVPFGESIRQTYIKALELNQEFIPVVDADVLLNLGTLQKGITDLRLHPKNIFCLDGKTNDKIFMKNRRAGIHIYRTSLLEKAMEFIDNNHIKPETNVRNKMEELGFYTHTNDIIFGFHDYEQYYKDLWRKAICQTQKLRKIIKNKPEKWHRLAKNDDDFKVIAEAHRYGMKYISEITIDSRIDFDAERHIKRLGLTEKLPL